MPKLITLSDRLMRILSQYSEAIREYREATKLKRGRSRIFSTILASRIRSWPSMTPRRRRFRNLWRLTRIITAHRMGLTRQKKVSNASAPGRKHQEDLLKKQQKEEELKKAGASPSPED